MRGIVLLPLVLCHLAGGAQNDSITISKSNTLWFKGYGEVYFNKPLSANQVYNAKLDVNRVILTHGYHFSETTQFIGELEFEHVKEIYVEQAYLKHSINRGLNLVGGLVLIPMGYINKYHEPTVFHGVDRPIIDTKIAPTTWREIGVGISGNLFKLNLNYEVYLVNGFKSYENKGVINGSSGFRPGRQRGARSFMSYPNIAGRLEYYGLPSTNLGISGYYGKTQSTLYEGIDKRDDALMAKADSSVVLLSMVGVDAGFNKRALSLRGQVYLTFIGNTVKYNVFTGIPGNPNDLGSAMFGYYVEMAYNVLAFINTQYQLLPFVRFEHYNTHWRVELPISVNSNYNVKAVTSGLTLKLAQGAVVKTDWQVIMQKGDAKNTHQINVAIGYSF